jgi:purine-binding chemotaxis protein CheW
MNVNEKKSSVEKLTAKTITLYDEEFTENKEVKENIVQLLIFRLSNEWYAVELEELKEIVKLSEVTYLPLAPKHIAGIINLKGKILSVTDMKKLFNLPQEDITDKTRLVVVEYDNMETGLLVDEVTSVANILKNKIDPPINTISTDIKDYIRGEAKINDRFVVLLNINLLFEKRLNKDRLQ